MKWIADIQGTQSLHLIIKHDERAGYYLYVYIDGVDTYDYLQDTLEITKDFALEKFQVPLDAWKKIDN